uniref:Uncharacterized protein n=1 Tax=Trypanosoma congolense (strain IL3000) TaxID=1068625 RepID=G0UY88_TRYCI|nr:conserved hypothetical protein [Trypanosoma congolense IL3000]
MDSTSSNAPHLRIADVSNGSCVDSSLLKSLLLELGLTETAKTFDAETRRLPERMPSSVAKRGNTTESVMTHTADIFSSNGSTVHDDLSNKDELKEPPCGSSLGTTDVYEKLLKKIPEEVSRMNPLRTLLIPANGSGGDRINDHALHDLCQLALLPMRRILAGCRPVKEHAGESAPLVPLLQRFVRELKIIPVDESCSGEHVERTGFGRGASIADIFFSYVEVLWAQLHVTEEVMLADVAPRGWICGRSCIFGALTELQEKLQHLLLEAHELKLAISNVVQNDANANGARSRNDFLLGQSHSGSLNPSRSPVAGASCDGENCFVRGVCTLFCHGEPTFRKNMNEIASWVMDRCTHCAKEHTLTDPLHFASVNGMSNSSCVKGVLPEEDEAINRKEILPQSLWGQILDSVRTAAIYQPSEPNSHSSEESGASAQCNGGGLFCAQTAARIHFLGWAIGSMVELFELLHVGHSRNCGEEITMAVCDENKDPQRTHMGSVVRAIVGVWFYQCSVHLTNELRRHHVDGDVSRAAGTHAFNVPGCARTAVVRNDCSNVQFVLDALKCAALELLTAEQIPAEARFQLLLCSELWRCEPKIKSFGGTVLLGGGNRFSFDNRECGSRAPLLEALITGKAHRMSQPLRKAFVSFQNLRKALRKTRTLLDLQDSTLSLDIQLRAMENIAAHALSLSKMPDEVPPNSGETNGVAVPEGSSGVTSEQHQRECPSVGRATISQADIPLIEIVQHPENSSDDQSLLLSLERPSIFFETIAYTQLQLMRDLMVSSGAGFLQAGLMQTSLFDRDDASSAENSSDNPGSEVRNEVQVIKLTPCGSLLALLTTKGRLIVYAMRSVGREGGHYGLNRGQFSERIVMDTSLINNSNGLRYYEQLSLFVDFSPCGRFLLCCVQHFPSFVEDAAKAEHLADKNIGNVHVYSLHCREGEGPCNLAATGGETDFDGTTTSDRLYAAYKVHKAPITMARWLDPRFWNGGKTTNTHPPGPSTVPWRRSAYHLLSFLQCISSGSDNIILRWCPADGSVLQSISTFPVQDLLFSPLMQAIYTINHYGQLSMYDAWNEKNINGPTDETIEISYRGLAAPLKTVWSSASSHDDGETPLAEGITSSGDAEMPKYFYMGSRVIRFDRRNDTPGGRKEEASRSCILNSVDEKGLATGVGTENSSRLGRYILREAMHENPVETYSNGDFTFHISHDPNASDCDGEEPRRGFGCQSQIRNSAGQYANPVSLLRSQQQQRGSGSAASFKACSRATSQGYRSNGEEAIMYKTGSRLVFNEVPHALCYAAHILPCPTDSHHIAPSESYHLLSMTASGSPTWNEDRMGSGGVTSCLCGVANRSAKDQPSACKYYVDPTTPQHPVGVDTTMPVHARGDDMYDHTSSSAGSRDYEQHHRHGHVCCRDYRETKLEPTAQNGRYLCIMASAGPNRSAMRRDQLLKSAPGTYACVVFDVLYGNVVRVIPVCPTLSHTSSMWNGANSDHSNARKAPIYVLTCSVFVASKQTMQKQQHNQKSCMANSLEAQKTQHVNGDVPPSQLRRGHNDAGGHRGNISDDDEGNTSVFVAVGGLQSQVYVFDALTGALVRVINLREENRCKGTHPRAERRPPAKRSRCSYAAATDGVGVRYSLSNLSATESDISGGESDLESSSSTLSNTFSHSVEYSRSNQRHILLTELLEEHGVSVVLEAMADVLSAVPRPFASSFEWQRRGNPDILGGPANSCSACTSSVPRGSAGCDVTGGLQWLKPYPSFLEQLRLASEDFDKLGGLASCASRSVNDKEVVTVPTNSTPFEFVSLGALRQMVRNNVASGVDSRCDKPDSSPQASAPHDSSRFSCGVVNSVAFLWDEVNDGIYILSSDEYGGVFITGGCMAPEQQC